MNHQQRSLRAGASVILCALLLRLGAMGFFQPVAEFLAKPNIAAFLIYLETGRVVRFSPSTPVLEVFEYESPVPDFALETVPEPTAAPTEEPEPPQPQTEPAATVPSFCGADGETVEFKYGCAIYPDRAALITKPLQWDLTGEAPTVLILHTHTTESYTKAAGEEYEESAAFRTLDEAYNMISVGDHLASLLEAGGITVLHDRALHDYPSYNGSYSNSRKSMTQYLKENPSIQLVLDLHRDASADLNNQMRTEATVDGKASAQIMLVVGTNASGLKHPHWEDNLALALKLQVQLERVAPGICRKLNLRAQRFNQDQHPGALLVEMGAAGNSRAEALVAAEVLAQAILDLAHGAQTVQ